MDTRNNTGSHALFMPIAERLNRFLTLKNSLLMDKEVTPAKAGFDQFTKIMQPSSDPQPEGIEQS